MKSRPPSEDLGPDFGSAELTDAELEAAQALRRALESPEGDSGGRRGGGDDESVQAASLLRSLSAAHAPKPIDDDAHRAIVARALARAPRRSGVVIRVAFGASAIMAAAAVLALVVRPPEKSTPEMPFLARSTQALFDEPFARGATTARIDRIAATRAAEFRENRFASWGVR